MQRHGIQNLSFTEGLFLITHERAVTRNDQLKVHCYAISYC